MIGGIMLAILLFLLFPSLSFARMVDYKCVSDCSARGYMYGYCQSVCSYNENNIDSIYPAIPSYMTMPPPQSPYGAQELNQNLGNAIANISDYLMQREAMRQQLQYAQAQQEQIREQAQSQQEKLQTMMQYQAMSQRQQLIQTSLNGCLNYCMSQDVPIEPCRKSCQDAADKYWATH